MDTFTDVVKQSEHTHSHNQCMTEVAIQQQLRYASYIPKNRANLCIWPGLAQPCVLCVSGMGSAGVEQCTTHSHTDEGGTMYADVTVVVEGAVEAEAWFTDYLKMDAFIEGVREDAAGDGYRTEVYVLEHEHAPGIECECAQYATNHKPRFTFNAEG